MSVAKIIELSSRSAQSFEDAIRQGIARASRTLHGITGAWVKEQHVEVQDGRVTGFRVNMMVTFVLRDGDDD
ncbi:dodecin family protein [Rubellimicrobium sp. CFH 75288]|uniref:dodecin family protein n=1 Tax=Rubellimicrobium sp. CFH 75288 TaxID=2697034 RepID=UPI0014126157|nr:dodecin family protein [Rubellimicrobium sp. CFH 75288]NAZ35295.1 dodecin domain-containing protein [Rubellimicrobium sp. CFH 75288]